MRYLTLGSKGKMKINKLSVLVLAAFLLSTTFFSLPLRVKAGMPVTIVIDSVAHGDSYSRYHALTIDNPIPKVFWKGEWREENPDAIIGITSGSFHYEETIDLPPGEHVIEYAVSSSAYYGLYWHATIEINGEVVAEGDCDVNRHLTAPFEVLRLEHDLAVALDAPSLLESGDSSLLNATVTNLGSNAETGVELFLLVDGTVVDSAVVPELLTDSSYTLSYLWTSTVEAIYNVTAYVPPVSGENITANNVATKMVNVGVFPSFFEPITIVIDSTAVDDSHPRYHALTIDNPIPKVFWKGDWYEENKDKVTIASGSYYYEEILDLSPGQHVIEYAVSSSAYYGLYWHATIEINGEVVAEGDCDVNRHLTAPFEVLRLEHDLAVALNAPSILELGDSSLLDATVTNWGLSNETDVELFLLVDGAVVDSATIPELLTDSSYTLSYLWTPTVEAIYNVTAYVPPVSGENFTVNNVATKIVNVGTPAHACKIYVDPRTTTAMLGETFVIDVKVADVTNLFGFEYKLKWNSTLLEVQSIQFHSPWAIPPAMLVANTTGVWADGRLYHQLAIVALSPQAPFTGNLTLATYTFTVISLGSCALDLDETKLVDNTATLIPNSVEDGYVTCIDTYLEGDVNQDAIVDIVDVVIVALAFGSEPGDDNWDPRADVANTFGLVDIVDIVFVAIHFGETG